MSQAIEIIDPVTGEIIDEQQIAEQVVRHLVRFRRVCPTLRAVRKSWLRSCR